MRKIILNLVQNDDFKAERFDGDVWHLENITGNIVVVHRPHLRRGLVEKCYILDDHRVLQRNIVLSRSNLISVIPLERDR